MHENNIQKHSLTLTIDGKLTSWVFENRLRDIVLPFFYCLTGEGFCLVLPYWMQKAKPIKVLWSFFIVFEMDLYATRIRSFRCKRFSCLFSLSASG